MGAKIEMTGRRFGKLVAIAPTGSVSHGEHIKWSCICDCGNKAIVSGKYLRGGDTTSCGCAKKHPKYIPTPNKSGHRMTETTEYNSWRAMRERCNNKNHSQYHLYGGRGITVCDSWNKDFESFFNDMGKKPNKKYTIDRKDPNKGYEPDNCRWATPKEQANNKRSSIKHEAFGKSFTITEWSDYSGFSVSALINRTIKRGIPLVEALSTPLHGDIKFYNGGEKLYNGTPAPRNGSNSISKRLSFYKEIGII